MPNIMLTYRCNLRCSYCFANEFVNTENTNITEENFDKAIEFITRESVGRVGLIGGEPTLHSDFKKFLIKIINNPRIQEATIYTNGILLDKFINQLVNPKFRLLINCNSPDIIGDELYDKIIQNLDILIIDYYMKDRINLGINLYKKNMNYEYIIELLKRYDLHRIRVSLTVPNFYLNDKIDALEYFENRKEFLINFFKKMDENNVLPYYDCNKPPYCVWSDNEKKWLENYVKKYHVSESNLIDNNSYCYPVIDILPDLQAVRCFGMSNFEKVKIEDFKSITNLASYYLNHVDSVVYKIPSVKKCIECYDRKIRNCTTGCIGFKQQNIVEVNNFIESING